MRKQIVYLTAFLLAFTGSMFAEHPETESQSQTNWSSAPAMTANPIVGSNAVCAGDTAGYSCTGTDDDTKQTRSRSRTELPIYDEECPPNLIGWYWPEWPDWPPWTTNSVGDGVHIIKWEATDGSISADGSFTAPSEGGQYVTITATLDDDAPSVVPPATGSRDDGTVQKTKEVAIVEVAAITVDEQVVEVDNEVTFTATTDPAGYEDLLEWSGGGDPATDSGPTFTTKWADTGEYTVTASCGTSSKSTNVFVVKLETETWATIPADRTRRKIGVGEGDTLTLKGADDTVTWSGGSPGTLYSSSGNSTDFVAYERASISTINAMFKGKTFTASFTVVEPSSESAVKTSEDTYPAGLQGVGMHLDVTLHPTDVSFSWVEIRELPGPATGVYGYFTNYPPLPHNPPDWLGVGIENDTTDHAWLDGWDDKPWYAGGFQWIIPMEWHVGYSDNISTLPNRVQAFSMTDENGTTAINKLGQSVTRTP